MATIFCIINPLCLTSQDYRSEVGEILAGDPQLVQEIQFDLKRFDEEQKRAVQSPAVTSPHGMMVGCCIHKLLPTNTERRGCGL